MKVPFTFTVFEILLFAGSSILWPAQGVPGWRLRLIVWVFPRDKHCVKGVRIWSYSGPHFSAFGVNTERYSVSLLIQSKCGKMRIRITPNMDTFYAVESQNLQVKSYQEFRYRWWRILIYSQFTCQSIDSFLEARKT